MSLFGEFHVSSERLALHDTLTTVPDTIVEIERVAATDELLTPYFWVSGGDAEDFEEAARQDPTVEDLRRLDQFDEGTHIGPIGRRTSRHWSMRTQRLGQ